MTTAECNLIDHDLLDRTTQEARAVARQRKNHNFHASDDAVCHRLLNAMEPGSYVRPHRHLDPSKDETVIVLRGSFGLVMFGTAGQVTHQVRIQADGSNLGVTIPHGTFHTLFALRPGSVFFEAKAGPYRPLSQEELASWAPAEGEPEAAIYLGRLESLFQI